MVKHIVFWKINQGGTKQDRIRTCKEFEAKLNHLKKIIPQIKEAKAAFNSNEGDVFHMCIDSVFENYEEMDIYINHPEHLKVREFLDSVSYDKAVFDYEF